MKKPDITEGEWVLMKEEAPNDEIFWVVNSEDGLAVHDSWNEANAQAISAVPEMIDALIKAVEIIDGEYGYYGENSTSQPMREALKKAGVTDIDNFDHNSGAE